MLSDVTSGIYGLALEVTNFNLDHRTNGSKMFERKKTQTKPKTKRSGAITNKDTNPPGDQI